MLSIVAPLVILGGVSWFLRVTPYAWLAVAIQCGACLLHGLPYKSVRLFDVSAYASSVLFGVAALMREQRSPRQKLLAALSIVWATRLGTFCSLRTELFGADFRFANVKKSRPRLASAFAINALYVVFAQSAVLVANGSTDMSSFDGADACALALWCAGFAIEAVADSQKLAFKASSGGAFINEGLWRYSQHPNYLGELAMMTGTALMAHRVDTGSVRHVAGCWLSPAFTALLLVKGTGIPQLDKWAQTRLKDDADYKHYRAHTSRLILWYPATTR